jgi:hypothetical protein
MAIAVAGSWWGGRSQKIKWGREEDGQSGDGERYKTWENESQYKRRKI